MNIIHKALVKYEFIGLYFFLKVKFGFVSLFIVISTFVNYLMPNPSL